MRPAPDAPAQLVQLSQPKMLRVLDEHHRRVRHVHTDLDERCGDERPDFVCAKIRHHAFLLCRLDASVQQADFESRQRALHVFKLLRHRLDVLVRVRHVHARINNVSLPPAGNFLADEIKNLRQLVRRPHKGFDFATTAGQFVNHRDIEVAVKRQAERSRNRRGRHHEQMRIIPFAHQRFALRHAKLVLLVHDDETKLGQLETRREQSMRADKNSRWELGVGS